MRCGLLESWLAQDVLSGAARGISGDVIKRCVKFNDVHIDGEPTLQRERWIRRIFSIILCSEVRFTLQSLFELLCEFRISKFHLPSLQARCSNTPTQAQLCSIEEVNYGDDNVLRIIAMPFYQYLELTQEGRCEMSMLQ